MTRPDDPSTPGSCLTRDPGRLVLMTLTDAPSRANIAAIGKLIPGSEEIRIKGKNAYLVYPEGIGRSRLSNVFLEKKLGTAGTGRNWNTVLKLAALVEGT